MFQSTGSAFGGEISLTHPTTFKRRRDLLHEALHLLFHLSVRLQADVEIENHLLEACGLHLFQGVYDLSRRAQQDRVFGQVLGLHFPETVDHVDKVAIARRRSFRVTGQSRNHALPIVADLARPRRRLILAAVGYMDAIAAHKTARSVAMRDASFPVEVGDLLETAVTHGSGKRGNNQSTAEPGGEFDRWLGE